MDLEEKLLIGSILSDDEDIPDRKQNKKLSKITLIYKELTPEDSFSQQTAPQRLDHKHNSYNYGNKTEQPLQFSPKKHQTMQPMQPMVTYQAFASHPVINKESDIHLQSALDQICGNQIASRTLQKIFDLGTAHERQLIFQTVIQNPLKISKDSFGNYTVQKIFVGGQYNWKLHLFQIMQGNFVELSLNPHSSRVIEKLLDFIQTNQQLILEFIYEIRPHARQLLLDNSGSFVLLKCLEKFPQNIDFVINHVEQTVLQISQQTYGCRIIQLLLFQNNHILSIIMNHAAYFCQNEFGNYIIQHILRYGPQKEQDEIGQIIKHNFELLSMNKYGSNTVEKYLDVMSEEDAKYIGQQLLTGPRSPQLFISLCTHAYGNYVMKKFLLIQPASVCAFIKRYPESLIIMRNSEYALSDSQIPSTNNSPTDAIKTLQPAEIQQNDSVQHHVPVEIVEEHKVQYKYKQLPNGSLNMSSVSTIATDSIPVKPYGRQPQLLMCKDCGPTVSYVTWKSGWGSFICGVMLFFSFLILCFFLPCCMRQCKDAHHTCSICQKEIGISRYVCD